jgi:7-cyano-7-deazaguanine synthase
LKAVVLLSGGIDSATALHWCLEKKWDVRAMTFDYEVGQVPDLLASREIARKAKVKHIVIDFPFYKHLKGSPSSRRGTMVDEREGISQAYVPGRNFVFFGMAAAYSETVRATKVVSGHNAGDAERFPDASKEFFEKFNQLLRLGLRAGRELSHVEVLAPFVGVTKAEVLREALRLRVPLEDTWSCYNNGTKPCGSCYGCQARRRAFEEIGARDPISER